MPLTNTHSEYGSISKWFHWIIALGVFTMIGLGISFDYVNSKPIIRVLITIHKSLGLTLCALMLLRLLWRWGNPHPKLPSTTPGWQRIAAKWSHTLLYLIVIIMPLTGLTMSTAGGHTTSFWWLVNVNMPWVPVNKSIKHLFENIHGILAWTLSCLIVLHILGALKHHIINRDNVLKRMMPRREPKYFR